MKKIFLISLLLFISSCSSRKVEKTQVDIKQSVVETTKDSISISTDIKQTVIDTSTCDEITYEPIVDSLPFIVNSKVFKNVKIKTRKSKNGISISKEENHSIQSSKIAEKSNTIQIESSEKKVDRETSYFWWWVLVVAVVLGWLYYDLKYR
jgi:uncharacterized protein YcfL